MKRRNSRTDTRRNTRRTLRERRRDDFKRRRDLDLERLRKRRREAVRALQKVQPPRLTKLPSRRRLDSPNLRRVRVRGGVPAALRSNTVRKVGSRLAVASPLAVSSRPGPRPAAARPTSRPRVERRPRQPEGVSQLHDTRCRRKQDRREVILASGYGGRNGAREYKQHSEKC